VPKRNRIRKVDIVPVPIPPISPRFSVKEQEMLRKLLKQKGKQDAEEKAAKKALERKIPKELKEPKEPKTKYPIRRVPKTRKKPPTSRRV
jgi:hypothetical protein